VSARLHSQLELARPAAPPGAERVTIALADPAANVRLLPWASRLAACVLLIVALPVILFLVAMIRLTSRGPGVYRQCRVGCQGREFTLFKLRSMRVDAEAGTGPVWATEDDPRVTRLGRFLRRSHLDELPQLLNVACGEMAFVGPRPERPEIVQKLKIAIPGYERRLQVPAGITGLAQVCTTPDFDLASARRKLSYDLAYLQLRETSPLLDSRILAATVLRMLNVERPNALRWVGLDRIRPMDQQPVDQRRVA